MLVAGLPGEGGLGDISESPGLGGGPPGLNPASVGPWISNLASLYLSLLICKIGPDLDLMYRVSVSIKGVNAGKMLGVVVATQESQGQLAFQPS